MSISRHLLGVYCTVIDIFHPQFDLEYASHQFPCIFQNMFRCVSIRVYWPFPSAQCVTVYSRLFDIHDRNIHNRICYSVAHSFIPRVCMYTHTKITIYRVAHISLRRLVSNPGISRWLSRPGDYIHYMNQQHTGICTCACTFTLDNTANRIVAYMFVVLYTYVGV